MTAGARVAVVGAGLAGLMAARTLREAGHAVRVLEKSRAPGGRAATRHAEPFTFDHGAQYFTHRDARLAPLVRAWRDAGVVAPWTPRLVARERGTWRDVATEEPRLVGVPGMRALGVALAEATDIPLDVAYGLTVTALTRDAGAWLVHDADGARHGPFDAVVVTAPAPQASALLAPHAPAFLAALGGATLAPCIACMLVPDASLDLPWDAAFINDDPVLSWVARDGSKPGRTRPDTWVLHATPAWSEAHVEAAPGDLVAPMVQAFMALAGRTVVPVHAVVHRWRYAIPPAAAFADGCAADPACGLAVAGDWCAGGRVEGALGSGLSVAARLLAG